MAERAQDPWARWLLEKRAFGGDPEHVEASRDRMETMRERVLAGAEIREGDVVLDVGTGEGLIAFAALPLVGESGTVIFSDISEELVEYCRETAGDSAGCEFLVCSADDLPLASESVDVVTTRSVLIYVKGKARAFQEFHRVLRPGGRVSIFEPINRFTYPEPDDRFVGYDVGPVIEIVRKLKAAYERIQPQDDPMLDFDERDLLGQVEEAGFRDVRMTLEVEIEPRPFYAGYAWETALATSGNPRLPPLGEMLDEALTPEEKERFSAHLRPLVERGEGDSRLAVAYLRAIK